jgi:hypothetical protein
MDTNVLRLAAVAALAGMLCGAPTRARATSIVGVRAPDGFYVAADSLVTHLGGEPSTMCKIGYFRGVLFAIAGMSSWPGRFDAAATARAAIGEGDLDLDRTVDVYSARMRGTFTAVAPALERAAPGRFFSMVVGSPLLETVFARRVGNGFQVGAVELDMDRHGNPFIFSRNVCPGQSCPGHNIVLLGLHRGITKLLQERPAIASEVGTIEALRLMIGAEANDQPASVGPPASVAEIANDGKLHWRLPGLCNGGKTS